MDKQQAAEAYLQKRLKAGILTVNGEIDAYQDGWEAREAQQSPVDAVVVKTLKQIGDIIDNMGIPYYAYGDNEAACAMAVHLNLIREMCGQALSANPSGEAQQAETEDWEDRCYNAEAALKELVSLKDWKERSGKDDVYLFRQPLAWAAARDHLATYYDEYEKEKLTPAPPAAGPVWVKASTRLPDDRLIVFKCNGMYFTGWHLPGHDTFFDIKDGRFDIDSVEWLDESVPAQQV